MAHNGRLLRHRFSPKSKSVVTQNSLPKRNHVAKEAVSTARQTKKRYRGEDRGQTKRRTNDEAAALRKNHVVGPDALGPNVPAKSHQARMLREELHRSRCKEHQQGR